MEAKPVVTWLLLILLAVVIWPIVTELCRKKMDQSARTEAPGQFSALSQGVTHFQWSGPEDGPVAVCIHGLTTPSFVWRSTTTGLVDQGFRVLTYDLYGRGFSDRPSGVQDQAFFLRQLNDLLQDQKVTGQLTVIGYSMGGVVAAAFASAHPDRVRDMILLAPAGMKTQGFGLLRQISLIPVVGLWLMLAVYPRVLRKGLAAEADLQTSVDGMNAMQRAELDWRGFVPSVRASIKGILTDSFEAAHRSIHQAKIPVMAVWGQVDDVIPVEAADLLQSWNPKTVTHIIENAGHGVTYTHTNDILSMIDHFTKPHR